MRGETRARPPCADAGGHFNPLPSCEGRRSRPTPPHAPDDFNPLPSCEGRRDLDPRKHEQYYISIHSPHARGDTVRRAVTTLVDHFNPLPSCEGRRKKAKNPGCAVSFQSTPLMRGETLELQGRCKRLGISIHSPHARGDAGGGEREHVGLIFQSTPLMRGETAHTPSAHPACAISIHSPHARGDTTVDREVPDTTISIHSPHARGDHEHIVILPSC